MVLEGRVILQGSLGRVLPHLSSLFSVHTCKGLRAGDTPSCETLWVERVPGAS